MPDAHEPTVLGLLFEGQARLETAVAAGFARTEGELSGLRTRIDKLEQFRRAEEAHQENVSREWTRREKIVGLLGGFVTVTGIWFGPILARGWH